MESGLWVLIGEDMKAGDGEKKIKYSTETLFAKIMIFMYLHINSHCSKMYSLPSCPPPKGPQLPRELATSQQDSKA